MIMKKISIKSQIAGGNIDAQENAPIRKIVPKGKKENAPIFQNNKK